MPNQSNPAQTGSHRINFCQWICLLLIAYFWVGCASSSRDLSQAASLKLKPGMTTAEVIQALGKPQKTVAADGQKTLAYYYSWRKDPRYTEPKAGYDGPTSAQVLSLRYDLNGKLEEFLTSDGAVIGNQKIRGGSESGNYVPALNTANLPNTSQAELVKRYGQPSGKSLSTSELPAYHWFFISINLTGGVETQELVVTFNPAKTVASADVNEKLSIPSSLFSLTPIKTEQPDFFRREVIPPDAVQSFF